MTLRREKERKGKQGEMTKRGEGMKGRRVNRKGKVLMKMLARIRTEATLRRRGGGKQRERR